MFAFLLACAAPPSVTCPEAALLVETRPEVPGNVVTLTWPGATTAEIWYGADPEPDLTTTADDTSSVDLYGLPFGADVTWEATTTDEGSTLTCTGSLQTGSGGTGRVELEVTASEPDLQSDLPFVMLASVYSPPVLLAIDRQARPVWVHEGTDGLLFLQSMFAQGSTDLLFNQFDETFRGDASAVVRMGRDNQVAETVQLPDAHHSFLQHEDGTLAYIALDVRDWKNPESGEVEAVGGDRIMERAPDGTIREISSTWDHLEPEIHDRWEIPFFPGIQDWSHGNALRYDSETDTYLLSMGNASIILEVERETGALVRQLGGTGGYGFAEGSEVFHFQHGVHWTDDGTLLMTSAQGTAIAAVEYTIDDDAGLLTEIWSHGREDPVVSIALGYVQRLDNGNTFVSLGSSGVLREVTHDGVIAWEARTVDLPLSMLGDPWMLAGFDGQ